MVMEKPSALLVGREFVRQYYTLLNQAPDFLHRFYGKSSSYVHGGINAEGQPAESVFGQADIHKKVMSLKFRDCHTKIRHVDALATLGDGVVVQVMGELSNAGLPMRRFMQTFVLAPEGSVPNKFYVHNDIFRYQDEVMDSDGDVAEESEEDVVEEAEEEVDEPQLAAEPLLDSPPAPVEGNVRSIVEQPEPIKDRVSETEQQSSITPVPEPLTDDFDGPIDGPAPALGKRKEEIVGEVEVPVEKQEVVKPSPSPTPVDNTPPQQPKQPAAPRPDPKSESQTGFPPRNRDVRPPRERTNMPLRRGMNDGGELDYEARRPVRYPDSQQIFVGNLPHDIDEAELKEFFMIFGTVMDLRINTKSSAGGSKVPNFGFVIFDDPEAVQNVLGQKPVMLRGDVRLNVEEKKSRPIREGERRPLGDEWRDARRAERGGFGGGRGGPGARDSWGAPPQRGTFFSRGGGRGGPPEARFGQRR
uniref:ras GTPase-activating protein-binding protein 2 isoform X1 n=1 Tax=Myxine glutinosa TaxID=7769 RepID=UPI00358E64F2